MAKNKINKHTFTKDSFSLDSFFDASSSYLETGDNVPVLVAESSPKFDHNKMEIEICFYDKLLERLIRNKSKYSRDLRDLVIYGYVGESKGGKNGLVVVSERDRNFKGIVRKFNSPKYSRFCSRIGILGKNSNLTPVKAVTHRKNGERIVGVFDRDMREAVLYEIRQYCK